MQRFTRIALAVALVASTLGATHRTETHAPRALPPLPFAQAGLDGKPVAASIRRLKVAFGFARSRSQAAAIVRARPLAVANASAVYKVIDLETIVPGFIPAALNNDGRIVGSSCCGVPETLYYEGHFINNDGFTGPLPPNQYCDGDDTDYMCSVYPTAVTNKSGAAAGMLDESIQYGCCDSGNYGGEVIWALGAKSATVTYENDGQYNRPIQATILSMANQNVPVGGRFYGDATHSFPTPFPIATCPLSNFSAMSINDSGVIAGSSNGRAATLTLGGCPAYVPNVGPGSSSAVFIADDGDMVLRLANSDMIWIKGRIVPIPLPPGYSPAAYTVTAYAINDSGVVVAGASGSQGSTLPAVSFEDANGHSVDLTSLFPKDSGWSALSALDINDHNEIIGQGMHEGAVHGFALRY